MIEKSNITYIIDGLELIISKPSWWSLISVEEETNKENCKDQLREVNSHEKWREYFKTYFKCGQINNEIPYQLSHIARDAGDYKLAIEIDLGLIECLRNSDSNLSWNLMYKRLGDSYIEIGDLNHAKEYYKKATVVRNSKDHSQIYYSSKAKVELEKLSLITDEGKYLSEMKQFRESLNKRADLFNSDSRLAIRKQQELNGFLSAEITQELNNLQLAFVDLLKDDFQSEEPKILTSKLKEQIRKCLSEYHEEQLTEFEIRPSGLIYPSEINNKWTLHFDGKDCEVVSVDFNRWQAIEINLSD